MNELPRHPETTEGESSPEQRSRPWAAYAIGLGVAAVIMLMVVLHLTGAVGPGAH